MYYSYICVNLRKSFYVIKIPMACINIDNRNVSISESWSMLNFNDLKKCYNKVSFIDIHLYPMKPFSLNCTYMCIHLYTFVTILGLKTTSYYVPNLNILPGRNIIQFHIYHPFLYGNFINL